MLSRVPGTFTPLREFQNCILVPHPVVHHDVLALTWFGSLPRVKLLCHELTPVLETDVVIVVQRGFLPFDVPLVLFEPHFKSLRLKVFPVFFSFLLVFFELVLVCEPELDVQITPLSPVSLTPGLKIKDSVPDFAPEGVFEHNNVVSLFQVLIAPLFIIKSERLDLFGGPIGVSLSTLTFSRRHEPTKDFALFPGP